MKFFQLCLLLIFLISVNGYSQKEKSNFEIQVYGIPYYKLSNYNYENKMQYKSDYFRLDYSERINQEMGLNFKYKLNKWKFGLGLSYNTFNFDHTFYMIDYESYNWQNIRALFSQELNITTLGVGLIVEREIAKTLNLGMRLSVNSSIKNELVNPTRAYTFNNGELNLEEKHKEGVKTFVIPEIFVSKTIYKGLDLIMGYKLGFFRRYELLDEIIYSIDVSSNFGRGESLYRYEIENRQTGFYFGASYTFKLPKLRKPKGGVNPRWLIPQ